VRFSNGLTHLGDIHVMPPRGSGKCIRSSCVTDAALLSKTILTTSLASPLLSSCRKMALQTFQRERTGNGLSRFPCDATTTGFKYAELGVGLLYGELCARIKTDVSSHAAHHA